MKDFTHWLTFQFCGKNVIDVWKMESESDKIAGDWCLGGRLRFLCLLHLARVRPRQLLLQASLDKT